MRMSTSMMYKQNMTGITGNQSLFMKAAEQLSTGKKVINPSDDPLAASRAVMLSQSQAEKISTPWRAPSPARAYQWKRPCFPEPPRRYLISRR